MSQRQHAYSGMEHFAQRWNIQFATGRNGDHFKRGSGFDGQLLPGNKIGMMLHDGDQDLISGPDVLSAEGLGYQIYTFSGTTSKNDFLGAAGIDELADLSATFLIFGSSFNGQGVNAPMDIGVLLAEMPDQGIDYGLRLVRCGGIIEINNWIVPVISSLQCRE